jgi:uncharacterized protein (TIGR00730 family)
LKIKNLILSLSQYYDNMSIQTLAVFCGSKEGKNPLFIEHAVQLGRILAEKNVSLVYGGGSAGIMGAVADSTMANGGSVIGVIPKLLLEWEKQHRGITELIISDDMHERKKTIYSFCDAALILPGGFGTLDELFEILTWNQLTIHDKQIFILNSGGFYDHLIAHIHQMREQAFLYEKAERSLTIIDQPGELTNHL